MNFKYLERSFPQFNSSFLIPVNSLNCFKLSLPLRSCLFYSVLSITLLPVPSKSVSRNTRFLRSSVLYAF